MRRRQPRHWQEGSTWQLPQPTNVYITIQIVILMIRIVGAGTAALHDGRGTYEIPREKRRQTVMDSNRRDAQKFESLRRHCPKPDVVKIGTSKGPCRTSRVDPQFSSVLEQFEQSISWLRLWCVR